MPQFLTSTELKEYNLQLEQLKTLSNATTYISDSLTALAKRHPKDQRYAELLALFIKYTKFSAGGSKQAFITLKKIYPNSFWARKTKYYY